MAQGRPEKKVPEQWPKGGEEQVKQARSLQDKVVATPGPDAGTAKGQCKCNNLKDGWLEQLVDKKIKDNGNPIQERPTVTVRKMGSTEL